MLLPSGLNLNLTPVKVTEIPSEDRIIQAGHELMDASAKWKHTKDFTKANMTVRGYSAPKDSDDEEPWFCRLSTHSTDEISFEEMWFGLGTDKPDHEQKFVHNIDHVVLLKRISENAAIYNLHYKFSPPISNRTFTVLQLVHLDTSGQHRQGIIVSIPIDVSPDAELSKAELRGARGRYVSTERIMELDDGKLEWRAATSSTPGGSIPSFIAQASIPGQVSHDVPLFFKWFNSDKEYFKKGVAEGKQAGASSEPAS